MRYPVDDERKKKVTAKWKGERAISGLSEDGNEVGVGSTARVMWARAYEAIQRACAID